MKILLQCSWVILFSKEKKLRILIIKLSEKGNEVNNLKAEII